MLRPRRPAVVPFDRPPSVRRRLPALVAGSIMLAGCSSSSDGTTLAGSAPPASAPTGSGTAPGSSTTASTAMPATEPKTFFAYWIHESEPAPNGTVTKVLRSGSPRLLTDAADAPRAAIDALIAGPTPIEDEAGLTSGFQTNVLLYGFTMDGMTAIVDFSRTFETHDTQPQVAQVVATLLQFPSVERVRFLIEGKPNGATGVPDKTLADVAKYVPSVQVSLPGPGSGRSEDGTIKTSGRALLTVPTIPWRVEGVDGPPLAEGTLEVKKQPDDAERGKWFALLEVPGPEIYAGPAWLTLSPPGEEPIRIPIAL